MSILQRFTYKKNALYTVQCTVCVRVQCTCNLWIFYVPILQCTDSEKDVRK